jgi:predicted metal-dependent hydrolase
MMREENSGEDGLLVWVIEGEGDKQRIAAKAVKARLKEIGNDHPYADERAALEAYADLLEQQTPRQFVERESHYLWGRRYLLSLVEKDVKPFVRLDHRRITLTVRPGSSPAKREEVMQEWHRALLHEAVPPLIRKWETKLEVEVASYFLQRMKTKWGGCNPRQRNIRLNTELVKKPKDLLEYVVLHEMVHLIEPRHNERFLALMTKYYPTWREARAELNELPLAAEVWRE